MTQDSEELRVERVDQSRTIAVLRRALAWHGDLARMATTREEWQQEIDAAITWVKLNPEPDRPPFPTLTDSPQSQTVVAVEGERAKLSRALSDLALEIRYGVIDDGDRLHAFKILGEASVALATPPSPHPIARVSEDTAGAVEREWESSLRPGNPGRYSGHLEARREIATAALGEQADG